MQTELILLREKNVQQCTGCDACYGTGKPCHINDDFAQIAEKLLKADLIVLATPNYFENVSGMMKTFIDRTDALCNPPQL